MGDERLDRGTLRNERLTPFGATVFSTMTRLANEHGAINLAQGFPDFEGPAEIVEVAVASLRSGSDNQYSRSHGRPELCEAVAEQRQREYGTRFDPVHEVAVTCGATEGIAAACLGLLSPGDRVVLFEPFYDSYLACCTLAGAEARTVPLRFPDFEVDFERVRRHFADGARLLILNSPHNPTGKVFDRSELERLAELCLEYDVTVLTDEVYEYLVFDDHEHVPMSSLDGMRERTVSLSSAGKSFSFTGWKVGWAVGPKPLIAAVRSAHQFLTFSTPAPFQLAIAHALRHLGAEYYDTYRAEYHERRDVLCSGLETAGFRVARPAGTYFALASFSGLYEGDDRSVAEELSASRRVTAIPPSAFYRDAVDEGRTLLRFAFCKQIDTLHHAASRLTVEVE